MTYGTAVEFPTGRIHEHVTQVLPYVSVLIPLYLWCVMTYVTAVEFPTGRIHEHVAQVLLYMCPHTTISPTGRIHEHDTRHVVLLILLYLCPHTIICVLILLYMCPHTSAGPLKLQGVEYTSTSRWCCYIHAVV